MYMYIQPYQERTRGRALTLVLVPLCALGLTYVRTRILVSHSYWLIRGTMHTPKACGSLAPWWHHACTPPKHVATYVHPEANFSRGALTGCIYMYIHTALPNSMYLNPGFTLLPAIRWHHAHTPPKHVAMCIPRLYTSVAMCATLCVLCAPKVNLLPTIRNS